MALRCIVHDGQGTFWFLSRDFRHDRAHYIVVWIVNVSTFVVTNNGPGVSAVSDGGEELLGFLIRIAWHQIVTRSGTSWMLYYISFSFTALHCIALHRLVSHGTSHGASHVVEAMTARPCHLPSSAYFSLQYRFESLGHQETKRAPSVPVLSATTVH